MKSPLQSITARPFKGEEPLTSSGGADATKGLQRRDCEIRGVLKEKRDQGVPLILDTFLVYRVESCCSPPSLPLVCFGVPLFISCDIRSVRCLDEEVISLVVSKSLELLTEHVDIF